MSIYFVTGIDTDAGKSYATGVMLRYLLASGVTATTFKPVQTGSADGASADILLHRRIAGIPLDEFDRARKTCPEAYTYPASPHLAAELDSRPLDTAKILAALAEVKAAFEVVLVEGAGGLLAPLTRGISMGDFAAGQDWRAIIVTSGKLGSINHTLLTIEAAVRRGLEVCAVLYNAYPPSDDVIGGDTRAFLREYLEQHLPRTVWAEVPLVAESGDVAPVDYSAIFGV